MKQTVCLLALLDLRLCLFYIQPTDSSHPNLSPGRGHLSCVPDQGKQGLHGGYTPTQVKEAVSMVASTLSDLGSPRYDWKNTTSSVSHVTTLQSLLSLHLGRGSKGAQKRGSEVRGVNLKPVVPFTVGTPRHKHPPSCGTQRLT